MNDRTTNWVPFMFGGVPKRATHTVISLLLLTAVSVLLLTGCSGGSQPVPDFNATVASEVTKETEPAAQATAEPTAKPTPVATVKSEPQPTPKAISTVTNPETISIKHPYLYIAETGGIGVRPRKDCKDESVRAFPEKIPEGTAVREEAIGKDECSGWRRVIAVSVKRDSFWVRERYLSSTYTVSVATTPTPVAEKIQEEMFWNEPYHATPKCTGSFQFTHMLVDVADVDSIGVSPGGHIAPHGHMAYWGTGDIEKKSDGEKQVSEKVQLYSPTDIFYVQMGQNTRKEWGGTLYTCDGYQIELGHVSDPSDQFNLILSQNEPEPGCDENSCRWSFPTFIPAGTPLFKSSGFTSGFDFGLTLAGLTAEELQRQPGYGYSITPWRTGGSGNAVCALEYFKEPLSSEYKKLLGDFNCGPFNQDVPGTAMGFWLNTPSTDAFPGVQFKDEWDVDEWKTIWLFQDFRKNATPNYNITVGNNIFGLEHGPHGEYSYLASQSGLVNRAWDDIKPGKNYCVELKVKENMFVVADDVHKILILKVSEDGKQLTVEALQNDKCGEGPWQFQGGERTFYR